MKPSGCRETVGRLHLFHAIKAVCHSLRFIHAILWLLCDIHLLARCHSLRFIHAILWLLCEIHLLARYHSQRFIHAIL